MVDEDEGGGEGGLRRWSRLKQRAAARRSGDAVAPADAPLPATVDETGSPPAAGDKEQVPLPSIDSLDKDSDFTPFLADGVPEDIARAALRKMWLSDPIFAFRDGLDDYDEDFTIIESIAKSLTEGGKEEEKPDAAEKESEAEPATEADQAADGEEATEAPEDETSEVQAVEATTDDEDDGDDEDDNDDDSNSGTPPNVPS